MLIYAIYTILPRRRIYKSNKVIRLSILPVDYLLYTCYTQVNENVTKLLRIIKDGLIHKTTTNEQRDVQGKKSKKNGEEKGRYL